MQYSIVKASDNFSALRNMKLHCALYQPSFAESKLSFIEHRLSRSTAASITAQRSIPLPNSYYMVDHAARQFSKYLNIDEHTLREQLLERIGVMLGGGVAARGGGGGGLSRRRG